NANEVSVRAALSVLRLQPARRRIAVLGDMLELGRFAAEEHAALAGPVTGSADLLFACGPMMRHALDAVPPQVRAAHAADSETLAPIVARQVADGDAILVKGSLGSRMKTVVNALDTRTAERG
ncbi:MAG: UDP-N-acetylmuramoyl-tripeptide--D-alanyl-D-alanine ligase, partial [Acetobacteraceae bacterium]|nr:UDP-N-acetylmuramoyl-tripeptide--D-alanyl-D-alanine ligase [Acetobacteraceae bacterium]